MSGACGTKRGATRSPRASTAGLEAFTGVTTPTAPTASATTTSPSADATDETVTVSSADFEGRDYREVRDRLTDLGLSVKLNEIDNDGSQQEGTVISVNPQGEVPVGSSVTVSYWGPAPDPTPTPTPSPTPTPTPTPTPSTPSPTPQEGSS